MGDPLRLQVRPVRHAIAGLACGFDSPKAEIVPLAIMGLCLERLLRCTIRRTVGGTLA